MNLPELNPVLREQAPPPRFRRALLRVLTLLAPVLAGAEAAQAQDLTVQKLLCRGNEPFWSLDVSRERARLSEPGETERLFLGELSRLDYLDPPWSVWRGRESPEGEDGAESPEGRDLVAVLRAEVCLDSMSEEGGPFDRRAVVTLPDGRLVTGCCRSAVGLDADQAPLADFEDIARSDWTGFLPLLAEAITGCVAEGFVGELDRVLGAWPLPRDQALVRAVTGDGERQDCIAGQADGGVVLSDRVSARAAKGRTEGEPSFYAASIGPPLATCGRLEKVVLPDKGLLGWLHYKGPDCNF